MSYLYQMISLGDQSYTSIAVAETLTYDLPVISTTLRSAWMLKSLQQLDGSLICYTVYITYPDNCSNTVKKEIRVSSLSN